MAENNHIKSAPLKSMLRAYVAALSEVLSWRVALALALMILMSLMEAFGLILLIPLLQSVGLDVQQGAMGRIEGLVSSAFTAAGIRPTLVAVLILYVLIASSQALVSRWQTVTNYALIYRFVGVLRQRLYEAIAHTNWLLFSKSRASDFIQALTTELDRVNNATYSLLFLMAGSLVTLVYVLLALQLSPVMTGAVFACGAGLLLLLKGRTRAAQQTGEDITEAYGRIYSASVEHLGGMKTVKSYGAEGRNAAIFSSLVRRVSQSLVAAVRNQADATCLFSIGSVFILGIILYVSFEVLRLPTATVLLLLFLFARIMPRLSGMQQNFHQLVNDLPAFANVAQMESRCRAAAEPSMTAHVEEVKLREAVKLERVSFSYEERSPLLTELSMTIPTRLTTAIVGASGAGKSTVADIVMGLITPDAGQVLIDDAPLTAGRMRSWRNQIGYVAQDTFLFHDTIGANLAWACPGATDQEIAEALRLAAADEFVSLLPEGVETVIGDRGVRLSGGERQRLALARALLRRPALLILDEATSALDSENERRIHRAIEELHGSLTILIITHRLSAIRNADSIYVIEQGSVVEAGDWASLMAREDGRFQTLCRSQDLEPDVQFNELAQRRSPQP